MYDINGKEISKGSALELVLKAGRKPVVVAKGIVEDLNRDDKALNDPVCKKKVNTAKAIGWITKDCTTCICDLPSTP